MSKQKQFILLRGLTRETQHWDLFPELLKNQFPQASIIFLDIPGAGKRHKEKCPLTVKAIVNRLRNDLGPDALENKENIFIGVSLGAMVGMKWGELYPHEIDSLVVINSSISNLSPIWKRMRLTAVGNLARAAVDVRNRESLIYSKACKSTVNRERLLKRWKEIQDENPVTVTNALLQIGAASTFRINKPLNQRGLVINSLNDELVNSDCSKNISQFMNWPIEVNTSAGHEITDDDPDWVIGRIKNFLL